MLTGLLIGLGIGIVSVLFTMLFFMMKDENIKPFACLIAFAIGLFGSVVVGAIYDNYNIEQDVAKYEAAYQTYENSINDPNITEYERVAILQTTMNVNQEIAKTKTYVNSWISIGITKENKEAVNNLKLIGE